MTAILDLLKGSGNKEYSLKILESVRKATHILLNKMYINTGSYCCEETGGKAHHKGPLPAAVCGQHLDLFI